jgi:hypothetical protein
MLQEQFHGRFKDSDYMMANHWDTDFPASLFGRTDPLQTRAQARSALEDDAPQRSAFPAFAHACSQCHLSVPLFSSSR